MNPKFLDLKEWKFPDDVGAGSGGGTSFGEAGDVAILESDDAEITGDDDDGPEDQSDSEDADKARKGGKGKGKEEDEDGEKEDEDEDQEVERDESAEEDEETEEVEVESKPRLKEITAKYPKLFKEFPALKDAYFRANAYSELFPSVDDAKEAAEKAETLDGFEAALVGKGSSLELLNSIKDTSPAALSRFVDKLLPTLYEFDSKLFYQATEPVTRQLLWSAHQHGLKTGNKNLVASAQHISNYLFEDPEVKQPRAKGKADPELNEERRKLEQDRNQFEGQKRGEFVGDLHAKAGKQLVKIINDGLDPKNAMTAFTRDAITDKVIEEVGRRLEADPRHMARMKSLYTRAARAGYPKAMTDQISSAYLSAAKALVPGIRSEMKQKALTGKVVKKQLQGNRQIGQGGGAGNAGGNGRGPSAKQVDWSKTSDEDFLAGRITLKK